LVFCGLFLNPGATCTEAQQRRRDCEKGYQCADRTSLHLNTPTLSEVLIQGYDAAYRSNIAPQGQAQAQARV